MAEEEQEKQGLQERLKDRLRDLVDGIAEALDGILSPQPELQPIPVRRPRYPRR